MNAVLGARTTRLFVVLAGFFVANAVIAEFVGVKIFALEATLGREPFGWNLFGQTGRCPSPRACCSGPSCSS